MTSGPIGPRPDSPLGPVGEFGDPLRQQEPQGPRPLPAMQGPPAPPADASLPPPMLDTPDGPRPMTPEELSPARDRKNRLKLLLASRSRALQTDVLDDQGNVVVPAMDPTAADAEAIRQLTEFVERGPTIYPNKAGKVRKVDARAELREYLAGGPIPIDWDAATRSRWGTIKSQQTIQDEVAAASFERGRRAAVKFREDSPYLSGFMDYVADPVTTFFAGAAQVPVDVVSGLTNIAISPFTDARIPPIELKRDAMTAASRMFAGDAGMAFVQGQEVGAAESKSAGAELIEGAAGVMGMIRGMAGKVGGTLLGAGGKTGEAAVQLIGRATGRQANKFWTAVGRGSGSFGAYEAVAGKGIDETTGELRAATMGDRAENMLRGMVVGPIVEGANKAATAALMRLYGRGLAMSNPANEKAVKSVLGWARKQGFTKVANETEEAFYARVVQDYVANGLPGARMSVRKAVGHVVRASVEGAGFASLDLFDAKYRAKLYQAFIEGNPEALSMMLMSWGQNALGLLFLQAKNPGDVLRMMRRRPVTEGQPRQPDMHSWNGPLRGGDVGDQGQSILGVAPDVARSVDVMGGSDPVQYSQERAADLARAEAEQRNRAWLEAFQGNRPQRTRVNRATGTAMPEDVNPQRDRATGTTLADDIQIDLGPARETLEGFGWEASYVDAGDGPRVEARPDDPMPGARQSWEAPPARTVRIKLPGTDHWADVMEGEVKLAPKTAEWLDLPPEVPVDVFAERARRATLLEGVQGQVYLPGTVILPGGVKVDAEGTLRQVRGGVIYEQKAEPGAEWTPAKDAVAVPPADAISPQQQSVVDALRYNLNNRADLTQGDRVLLSAVVDAVERVSPARDEGVADLLSVVGPMVDRLETGTPQQAAQVIDDLAEILSLRSPEAVLGRRAAAEQAKAADAEFEQRQAAEEQRADEEATARAVGEGMPDAVEPAPRADVAEPAQGKPEAAPEIAPEAAPRAEAEAPAAAPEVAPPAPAPAPAPAPSRSRKKRGTKPLSPERQAERDAADAEVRANFDAFKTRRPESVGYATMDPDGNIIGFSVIEPKNLAYGQTIKKMSRAEYEQGAGLDRSINLESPQWVKNRAEFGTDSNTDFALKRPGLSYGGIFHVEAPRKGQRVDSIDITHMPSGFRLPITADSQTRAREFVEKIWERLSPEQLKQFAAVDSQADAGSAALRSVRKTIEAVAEELGAIREDGRFSYTRNSASMKAARDKVEQERAAKQAARDAEWEKTRDSQRVAIDALVADARETVRLAREASIPEGSFGASRARETEQRLQAFDEQVAKQVAAGRSERDAVLRAAEDAGIKLDASDVTGVGRAIADMRNEIAVTRRRAEQAGQPSQVASLDKRELLTRLRHKPAKMPAGEAKRMAKLADSLERAEPNTPEMTKAMSEAQAAVAGVDMARAMDALNGPLGKSSPAPIVGSLTTAAARWSLALASHPKATLADAERVVEVVRVLDKWNKGDKSNGKEIVDELRKLVSIKPSPGSAGLIFTPGSLSEDAALVAQAARRAAQAVADAAVSAYSYAFEPTWRYLQRYGSGRLLDTARSVELRGSVLSGNAERPVTGSIAAYRRVRAMTQGEIDNLVPNEAGAMEPAWVGLIQRRRDPQTPQEVEFVRLANEAGLTMWNQLRAAGAVRTHLNAEGNIEYRLLDEREVFTAPRYPGRDYDAVMGTPEARLRYWEAQAERNPAMILDAETGQLRPRTGQDLVNAMIEQQSSDVTLEHVQRTSNAEIARELHNLDYVFEGREVWSTDFELMMEQTHMQQPRRAAWIESYGPGVPADVAERLGLAQNVDPAQLLNEFAASLHTGSDSRNKMLVQQARDYSQILQGRNPHLKDSWFNNVMRTMQPIENLTRAALTGVKSALWDLPAAVIHPLLYSRRGEFARVLFEMSDPETMRRNWRDAYENAFRIGVITRSVASHDQAVPASLRGLGRMTRILNRPAEISEQFKGAMAFRISGMILDRWDAGHATAGDANLLRILRLPQRYAEGRLTQHERDTFQLEYAKQLTARTDLAGASAMASDPGWRMHVRFLRWATRAAHNATRVVQAVQEAQTPAERRAAWERVVKMGLVYTSSGLAGQLLGTVFADMFKGENGFDRFWRELTATPMAMVTSAVKALGSQVTGGAVSTLLGFAEDPSAENMARLTVLSQYGYTAAKGVMGLADALHSYSTGEARKDPQALLQFIYNTGMVPLAREMGSAAKTLHAKIHGYDSLLQDSELVRWYERMAGVRQAFGERKWPQAYYDKLVEMERAIAAGAKPSEWVAANLDGLREVLEVAPSASLAQAMRARQLTSNWTSQQRQEFAGIVNDEQRLERIYSFDKAVRDMAREIGRLEGARPTAFVEELDAVTSQAALGASDRWKPLVEMAVEDAVAGNGGSIIELADRLAMFPHQLGEVFSGEATLRRLNRTKDVSSRAWMIRRELEIWARERQREERRNKARGGR